ncbi:MAG: MFS transporter [Hyphomicrobiales bacterium]|nr:MFS transporter [Hyphomicrobiales bacterium]
MTSPATDSAPPSPLWRLCAPAGAAQLYAWGVIYYPFTLTGRLIAADVGVSAEWAFAGFSLLLIVSAICAPAVGRAIDARGGRAVLTAGALVAAAALVFASQARGPVSFFLSCTLLGVAAAMTLYEAGFAALVQMAGARGRRAITYVTFMGGFASTVFWPVTNILCDSVGWRTAYLVYGVGMLLFYLPIQRAILHPQAVREAAPEGALALQPEQPLQGSARRRAFILLAGAIAAHQLVMAGLLVHIIAALRDAGLANPQAVMVGMAFGPAQVAGRFAEMLWGARFPAVTTGRIATALMPPAMLLLAIQPLTLGAAFAFAICFGASNGLMTIARGSVTLDLFGRANYGAMLGRISAPSLGARAVGPVALAYGLSHLGLRESALACAAIAAIAVVAMEIVARIAHSERQGKRDSGGPAL